MPRVCGKVLELVDPPDAESQDREAERVDGSFPRPDQAQRPAGSKGQRGQGLHEVLRQAAAPIDRDGEAGRGNPGHSQQPLPFPEGRGQEDGASRPARKPESVHGRMLDGECQQIRQEMPRTRIGFAGVLQVVVDCGRVEIPHRSTRDENREEHDDRRGEAGRKCAHAGQRPAPEEQQRARAHSRIDRGIVPEREGEPEQSARCCELPQRAVTAARNDQEGGADSDGNERLTLRADADTGKPLECRIRQEQVHQRRPLPCQRSGQRHAKTVQKRGHGECRNEIRRRDHRIVRPCRTQTRVRKMDGRRLLIPGVPVWQASVEDPLAHVGIQALVGAHGLDEGGQAHDEQDAGERQEQTVCHRKRYATRVLEL